MNEDLKLYENKFTLPITPSDYELIKTHIENLSTDEITHEILLLITYYKSKLSTYEKKI
jgi:hypothetical protein